jgi:hypothetical protein
MSMKIKENPDGTKELEGTPEELAEFERRRRGDVNEDKKDKKKVLLEGVEDIGEMIRKIVGEELEKRPTTTITFPPVESKPMFPCVPTVKPFGNPEPWIDPYRITWGGRWTLQS